MSEAIEPIIFVVITHPSASHALKGMDSGVFVGSAYANTGQCASSEYYKRVSTYALFTCTQGKELYKLCNEVVASGERRDITVHVTVTAPAEFGDEPVARISQVMSIKNLSAK